MEIAAWFGWTCVFSGGFSLEVFLRRFFSGEDCHRRRLSLEKIVILSPAIAGRGTVRMSEAPIQSRGTPHSSYRADPTVTPSRRFSIINLRSSLLLSGLRASVAELIYIVVDHARSFHSRPLPLP